MSQGENRAISIAWAALIVGAFALATAWLVYGAHP